MRRGALRSRLEKQLEGTNQERNTCNLKKQTIKVKQSKKHEHTEQHLCISSYNYLIHEMRPSYNCCQIERSKAPFSKISTRHLQEPNDQRYQLRIHSRPKQHEEVYRTEV